MNNWIIQDHIQTGRSHDARQLLCQDALASVNTEELVLSIAADGVGSLSNSHIAARAAVEGAADWFSKNLKSLSEPVAAENAIRQRLITTLKRHINARANELGVLPSTMDCNLAFACIIPAANYAFWGVLGDGAVCIFKTDHSYVLSAADSVLANGTASIMQDNAAERLLLQDCRLSDGKLLGFMVMTDGLENELYHKNSVIVRHSAESYFNAMLLPTKRERADAIKGLLNGLPDTFDDDISLSIISDARRSTPIVLEPDPTWLCACENRNPLDAAVCSRCQTSFRQLYGGLDFGSDPEMYFLGLNRDPVRERAMLNLPASAAEKPVTPRPPVARRPRNEEGRYSAGQMRNKERPVQNTRAPSGKDNVSSTVRGANAPEKKNNPLHQTGTGGQMPPNTNHSDGFEGEKVGEDSTRKAAPPAKRFSIDIRTILSVTAIILSVVAIVMCILTNARLTGHMKSCETSSQVSGEETATPVEYIVEASYVYVQTIADGALVDRLDRLETGSVVQRLDDQEIRIGEVVYICVRTEENIKGWCNLAALAPLENGDAS